MALLKILLTIVLLCNAVTSVKLETYLLVSHFSTWTESSSWNRSDETRGGGEGLDGLGGCSPLVFESYNELLRKSVFSPHPNTLSH